MVAQQILGGAANIPLLVGGKPVLLVGTRTATPTGSGSTSSPGTAPGSGGFTNVTLFGHGQSNASYANDTDGALLLMAEAITYWLGATGAPAALSASGVTDVAGTGVYCGVSGYGSFLTWTADTITAAQAAVYSGLGNAMLGFIASQPNSVLSETLAIVLYWGETDSTLTAFSGYGGFGYGDKAVYKAALLNDIQQIRSAFGKTASELPVVMFGPPYGTPQGYAMVREAWDELEANPANNFIWAVRMTDDSITRGDTWDSTTGVEVSGSPIGGHRSAQDNQNIYVRGGVAAAHIIQSSKGLSGIIPPVAGTGRGPQITAAGLSGTTLTLTITHDAGTDLVVPLLAADGVGFALMDGGSVNSPGNIIQATSCARQDATHLTLTLASAPTNAHTSCRLFYPWNGETWAQQPLSSIGRGCAVTDNLASIFSAAGVTNPAAIPLFGANMPLCTPVTRTGSGASASTIFGIPLSS